MIMASTPLDWSKEYLRDDNTLQIAFPQNMEEANAVRHKYSFTCALGYYCWYITEECNTLDNFSAEGWKIIKRMLNLFTEYPHVNKAIQHILILEDLNRFVRAHEYGAVYGVTFQQALQEIKDGGKKSHWIWYILPQLKNSHTHSKNSEFYAIQSRDEAIAYIQHPLLRQHLFEMAQAMLDSNKTLGELFGEDAVKVRSCFRLFNSVTDSSLLRQVVNKFYLY